MGVARTIYRRRYTAARAATELGLLLENAAYARRAAQVQKLISQEDGVKAACDALEGLLEATNRAKASSDDPARAMS
jgi:rhamnosyltransferase subunit B